MNVVQNVLSFICFRNRYIEKIFFFAEFKQAVETVSQKALDIAFCVVQ